MAHLKQCKKCDVIFRTSMKHGKICNDCWYKRPNEQIIERKCLYCGTTFQTVIKIKVYCTRGCGLNYKHLLNKTKTQVKFLSQHEQQLWCDYYGEEIK